MVVPPTIQTPPYKPTKPSLSESEWKTYPTTYTTPCHFGIPTFLHVLKDLTLHPERNSSLILRADPLPLDTQSQLPSFPSTEGSNSAKSGKDGTSDNGDELERWFNVNGLEKVEEVRVRLMPKQPQRDTKLDQRVLFYRTPETVEHEHQPNVIYNGHGDATTDPRGDNGGKEQAVVVMIPLVKVMEDMPFYHPPVRKIVFRYEALEVQAEAVAEDVVEQMENLSTTPEDGAGAGGEGERRVEDDAPIRGHISISYLPFDLSASPSPTRDIAQTSTESLPPLAGLRRTSLPRKRSPLAGPPTDAAAAIPTKSQKEDPQVVQARLQRTCLALLERVYKHGFGTMIGYKKRVNHDVSSPFFSVTQRIGRVADQ